jgi:hypothetical protein
MGDGQIKPVTGTSFVLPSGSHLEAEKSGDNRLFLGVTGLVKNGEA